VALSFIRRAIGAATCGTALALSFSGMPVVTVHGIVSARCSPLRRNQVAVDYCCDAG
jgi:hypothetical protein